MIQNPKIEISGMAKGEWIRLTGQATRDTSTAAKKAMLDANPSLSRMNSLDDGVFEVFAIENATAEFNAFGKEPTTETF